MEPLNTPFALLLGKNYFTPLDCISNDSQRSSNKPFLSSVAISVDRFALFYFFTEMCISTGYQLHLPLGYTSC
jgi:hypothetical protein